jgi:hypothetical protein
MQHGLGPLGLALVKQELGALLSDDQRKYWALADLPFDLDEYKYLVEHYLTSYVASRSISRATRSGRLRESIRSIPVKELRIEKHYPRLAPALLRLHDAVKSEQQQGQQEQQQQGGSKAEKNLLHVLRCLCLWSQHQATEPQLPSVLQCIAAKLAGKDAEDPSEVVEVLDLCEEEADEAAQDQAKQAMQDFLCDLVIVKDIPGRQVGHSLKKQGHMPCFASSWELLRTSDQSVGLRQYELRVEVCTL